MFEDRGIAYIIGTAPNVALWGNSSDKYINAIVGQWLRETGATPISTETKWDEKGTVKCTIIYKISLTTMLWKKVKRTLLRLKHQPHIYYCFLVIKSII